MNDIRACTDGQLPALWAALPRFAAFAPYRGHRLFSRDEQQVLLRADIARQLAVPGAVARVLLRNDAIAGLCVLAPLAWDSAHFGLPMARLDAWLDDAVDAPAAAALLAATLAQAPAALRHVSIHVDADDYRLLHALQQQRFLLMDAKRTFVARRHQRALRNTRVLEQPRTFLPADRAAVEALAQSAAFASRFTRDPLLDPARCAELYRLWMARLLDTAPARRALYVVERGGDIVACGGVLEVDFTAAGVDRRILADGVFACSTRGVGSYHAVIDALVGDGLARYPLLETRVSANNAAAVRVLESLGYSTAANQYALHLHLP